MTALELPLRILVWDQDGKTIFGYNDPKGFAGAYHLTAQATTLAEKAEHP
ncbi:MAG TPA: DUF302 domain-containing protein [Solirubrobacteraceae bacterium]|nr:DUF302 domain-containing protein [Solirubrobacteraceae bacterium]